jgi:hypothetical protein
VKRDAGPTAAGQGFDSGLRDLREGSSRTALLSRLQIVANLIFLIQAWRTEAKLNTTPARPLPKALKTNDIQLIPCLWTISDRQEERFCQ